MKPLIYWIIGVLSIILFITLVTVPLHGLYPVAILLFISCMGIMFAGLNIADCILEEQKQES